MIERIRAICEESTWLLDTVLGQGFLLEIAIRWVEAALNDLEATDNPVDEQVEEVFTALDSLKDKLIENLSQTPIQERPIIENLTDRIDIFLYHHRLS